MSRTKSETGSREGFGTAAQEMHRRLHAWRRGHPDASFDEIAEQVRVEREALIGGLLGELATTGEGREPFDAICPECGGRLENKGKKKKVVLHREGEVRVERDYYYCPVCQHGVFPPGP